MNVLIMAGGTGGHVFPALAVAARLKELGHRVTWMGAPDSFEARRVPEAGFPIEFVRVSGLRGKGSVKMLAAPLLITRAVHQALGILGRVQPDVVLGMGGFAAGPGGFAAWLKRIPLVIHEQNAAAGLTNRLLAVLASAVLQAFPATFRKGETVGNPVRSGFAELPPPAARIGTAARPRVLVVGGSQGSRALNQIVPAALARMPPASRPQVRHQAGRTLEVANSSYGEAGVHDDARVEAFITDMPSAFARADLVVCRSGASTIAELSAAGVASILVPFPFAVDDHQTANAHYLSDAGAAVLIAEKDLSPERLAAEFTALLVDKSRLVAMANAAREKAWGSAVEKIIAALTHSARSVRPPPQPVLLS